MKISAILFFFVALFPVACSSDEMKQSPLDSNSGSRVSLVALGEVVILNESRRVDHACLQSQLEKLDKAIEEQSLSPVRTKIFDNHTIVREAMGSATIHFTRAKGKSPKQILIPLSHNGGRIILFDYAQSPKSYALYSQGSSGGFDFVACFQ